MDSTIWGKGERPLSDCFRAQTIPTVDTQSQDSGPLVNPDVGGIAVAISNIAINVALPILLRWGPKPVPANTTNSHPGSQAVQTAVVMLLTQVYPILVATAASIGTSNLSLFDAHFAVAVTASPVALYFCYSAFRDLLGRPNNLFRRLTKGKLVIRYLGVVLPFLWLAVNIITSFNPHAFRNSSEYCNEMTLPHWLEFQAVSNFVGVLDVMGRRDLWNDLEGRGGLGMVSLLAMWIWAVYLVRHLEDVVGEYKFRKSQTINLPWWKRLPIRLWDVFAVPWFIITTCHPWMVFVIVMCLHWSWVLGIVKGMVFDGYQFSYGQITSLFAALPPLFALCQLIWNRLSDLFEFLRTLPRAFRVGLRFLLTGEGNPWDHHPARHPLSQRALLARLKTLKFIILINLLWLAATCADVFWIMGYVHAGSIPNPRTPVNDPHSGWKPFSVSLYIYGYCMCYVNIFMWTRYWTFSNEQEKEKMDLASTESVLTPTRHQDVWRILNVFIFPLALIMCVGPLYSPFAALPLAEQWQWDHFCDTFPGEAILVGGSPLATATLYYQDQVNPRIRKFSVEFSLETDIGLEQPTFQSSLSPVYLPPGANKTLSVSCVVYQPLAQTFNATCESGGLNSSSSAQTEPCGYGNYYVKPYLNFTLHSIRSQSSSIIRAVDREWQFNDDAPSVVLEYLSNGKLGNVDIQTAVTKRNNCNILKVCLASPTPDLQTIAPLGVILRVQTRYADYCLQPRIYSI